MVLHDHDEHRLPTFEHQPIVTPLAGKGTMYHTMWVKVKGALWQIHLCRREDQGYTACVRCIPSACSWVYLPTHTRGSQLTERQNGPRWCGWDIKAASLDFEEDLCLLQGHGPLTLTLCDKLKLIIIAYNIQSSRCSTDSVWWGVIIFMVCLSGYLCSLPWALFHQPGKHLTTCILHTVHVINHWIHY